MPASRESAQATLKVLLVAALLGWLWMSYGTQTPTRYQPFPGTNSYWQPLTFFLAVIAAAGLSKLRPKWSTAAVGVLVLMSLATASLSGPWGQGVKNSELLLQCVKTWPHVSFVADDRTIEDMYVLNGLSIPENIFSTPVARPEIQKLVPPPAANARGTFVMMVNPMRDRVFDTTTTDWIAARRGPEMHTGPTVYRPIGYLLPESLRSRYNFLVRREPYRLHEYAPGKAQMTTPPTQP